MDDRLASAAARQHGMLTREQLARAGLNREAIKYRLAIGRLHLVHRCVYAVGHVPPSPNARAMAAVLACGADAVLSHRSAGALWRITPAWRGPVEVSGRRRSRQPGIGFHWSGTLAAPDVSRHWGIPITAPARTILDLADVLAPAALVRAVNEAQVLHLVGAEDLDELIARSLGRHGLTPLRAILERTGAPTESAFEDAFLAFVERYDLPVPEVQCRVAGYRVDMLWRAQHLIVELDGRDYHDTAPAFESDREKDANLSAEGFVVVRITWKRLKHSAAREAWRLRALLAARGPAHALDERAFRSVRSDEL